MLCRGDHLKGNISAATGKDGVQGLTPWVNPNPHRGVYVSSYTPQVPPSFLFLPEVSRVNPEGSP